MAVKSQFFSWFSRWKFGGQPGRNRIEFGKIAEKRGAGSVLLLVFLLSGCQQPTEKVADYSFVHGGWTMGTSFSIKVPALPDGVASEALKQRVDAVLSEINGAMSTYLEDSELSKINRSLTGEWQKLSPALFTVISEAQRISRLSGGAFDVTVGPLVNLWGFGPDKMVTEPPPAAEVAHRLRQTGYQELELNPESSALRKTNPSIYLDLSALAKGYAVDRVADLLEAEGISDYMVEIGGELRLKGRKSDRSLWRIAVEKPAADRRMIQKILPISDIAIATSGDYRNFFEENGVRYSHTIDPRTGYPIKHKLASVTILSHTAMEADALATALMVLGPEEGYALAEKEDIAALLIVKHKDGFREKASTQFKKLQR
ncbi:MAG: FAD:protein FMN transferase [Gammaproteobacteria bacterium]